MPADEIQIADAVAAAINAAGIIPTAANGDTPPAQIPVTQAVRLDFCRQDLKDIASAGMQVVVTPAAWTMELAARGQVSAIDYQVDVAVFAAIGSGGNAALDPLLVLCGKIAAKLAGSALAGADWRGVCLAPKRATPYSFQEMQILNLFVSVVSLTVRVLQ